MTIMVKGPDDCYGKMVLMVVMEMGPESLFLYKGPDDCHDKGF